MEYVALDVESQHLGIADLDALRVVACIKLASYRQTCLGRRGRDQFNHGFPADQGCAPSVLCDVAEQAVLDLVPLRCARRVMAHLKRQAGFVGEVLKLDFEQAHA